MVELILRRSCLILLGVVAAASVAVAQSEPVTGPKITSVSKITTSQLQTITIKGSGFGTQAPYTGDSNYIALTDLSKGKWQAGYSKYDDTVTLIVNSWTNTQITLGGFSGAWGTHNFTSGMPRPGPGLQPEWLRFPERLPQLRSPPRPIRRPTGSM
jgi:hypothetical protein